MLKEILVLLGQPGYWLLIFFLTVLNGSFSLLRKVLFSSRQKILKFALRARIKSLTFLRFTASFLKRLKINWLAFKEKPKTYHSKKIVYRPLKLLSLFKKGPFCLKLTAWLKVWFSHKRVKPKTKRTKGIRKPSKKLAIALIIVGLALTLLGLIINVLHDMPSPNKLIQNMPSLTTKIYDRSGILLYKIYRDQNRTLVPLEKIPPSLINATLAIEDKEFFEHRGLSLRGILRAILHDVVNPDKSPIGGSTITQQLVKNALLTPEKSWRRKIKEAILALLVEIKFSKTEILQMYFNEVPFGGVIYGAEEASQKYFGKHVWEINQAEAALIAGITRAPTKYSPFGAYPELAKKRQEQVINEMVKANYLRPEEASQVIAAPLRFVPQGNSIKAPHFVFYIKELLVENYGQQMVEGGGLEVFTSLDWEVQKLAEKVVREEVDKLSRLKIGNGAALVTNPKTGEILAMVGSKDYFDFENDGNVNVTLQMRQPGSAIKPVNYAVALGMGYTPATIIPDTPIVYKIPGQPPYSPRNYDNSFHGNIPLRIALASSLNVPAVKVLSSYGVERMINMGKAMGINTWNDTGRFGLSLTLGGGEIRMIEIAQAYSVFANLGKKVSINPFLTVKNSQGKVIFQNNCVNEKVCHASEVLDSRIAFLLNDILSDNNARALAFGTSSLLQVPGYKPAVKTGTTNNLRDNWCIGYTPSLLTAVWVGNNDNSPMSYVASGVTGATPIWNKIMKELLKDKPKEEWPLVEGIVKIPICQATGTLTCADCPKTISEYFLKERQPITRCNFVTATPTPGI